MAHRGLSNNKCHIIRHSQSRIHKSRIAALKNQPAIRSNDDRQQSKTRNDAIKIAELRIIMFILQFNLAFSISQPLIDLIKAFAFDSKIAKCIKFGKNKSHKSNKFCVVQRSFKRCR